MNLRYEYQLVQPFSEMHLTYKMKAYLTPDHPGQLEFALQWDVALGTPVELVEVGVAVARQLQALEILEGTPEQADTNAGTLVVFVAYVLQKGTAEAEDPMKALKQLS
jgi:hypothetical protein